MQDSQVDSAHHNRKPDSEDLPPSEVDFEWVRAKVEAHGVTVVDGPFLNREYLAARGVVMVRLKIRQADPGPTTSVRFFVRNGELEYVSTSGRKKSSKEYRQHRKGK